MTVGELFRPDEHNFQPYRVTRRQEQVREQTTRTAFKAKSHSGPGISSQASPYVLAVP